MLPRPLEGSNYTRREPVVPSVFCPSYKQRLSTASGDLVPFGALTVVGGRGGIGKSTWALDIGIRAASGLTTAYFALEIVCLTNGQKDPDLDWQRPMFLLTCFLNAMHFGNLTGIL
ncbi:hypothetical protein [Nostoc sp. FACHB-892]|uniref:hypothetical protein n=1 Tax=Nostoc sp. FACHB-892 TaxID=2692843 RepID=UPI0018F005E2|nr:hypothetical protein [Nostoc sp. FACHB-892]